MEELELLCFEIISSVGASRSCYVEAIQAAKKDDFEKAAELLDEGRKHYRDGHLKHASLIQKEAAGGKTEFSILLVHAEDQMMSAEVLEIFAQELVELYNKK
ncbi:PTS cellobiose transporter subunit IIA [Anaerocolumna cellulosilytica]|uniref:PTS cellobiose transporter subunit IIA n=1 Tax=Anaerocolumna cellulosilytica TaxID=433286 RepID=A0A6S6R1J5_9FIRM|nr:PTS lactose/cellobiose transporter subunit IIA [Anaerocolumna cellulosilytica]MBB5196675.1 PTS system cellobiose-specific IIA component [Anaerocolumna cellulosilytica]BCJ93937.1 PTS cellobiose transporter subunit IIA [Anaerocolumna cellulosilytica]